jgi:4-diphosphocytidyl-2-C-methyl-D-erythritol kinase
MNAHTAPSDFLTVQAPAKVNLTLELLGARPDGYHELRSLLVPVSLYETVEVRGRTDGEFTCRTELVGVPPFDMGTVPTEKNLAVRAAMALRSEVVSRGEFDARTFGADIRVAKRVPVGAGLGGGSADAAGALLALDRAWGLAFSRETLADVGATFASDVPAMVLGGPVRMEGRGERVSRMKGGSPSAPPLWMVLAFCGESVSTKAVYGACPAVALGPEGCLDRMEEAVRAGDPGLAAAALFNGLEATVFRRFPRTAEVADALCRAGAAGAMLTGSGGAVIGLANGEGHARSIQARLPEGLWSAVVHTLPFASI